MSWIHIAHPVHFFFFLGRNLKSDFIPAVILWKVEELETKQKKPRNPWKIKTQNGNFFRENGSIKLNNINKRSSFSCLFIFFRFVYDEMTKNGRVAMLKGVTPVDSTTVALTVGPINSSNMKILKGSKWIYFIFMGKKKWS